MDRDRAAARSRSIVERAVRRSFSKREDASVGNSVGFVVYSDPARPSVLVWRLIFECGSYVGFRQLGQDFRARFVLDFRVCLNPLFLCGRFL